MRMILTKILDLIQKIKYKLSGKHKYALELKARVGVAKTQKQLDLIEVEINRKLVEDGLLYYERAYLSMNLDLILVRRDEL